MSDMSNLSQLARFVGQSALFSSSQAAHARSMNGIAARLMQRHRPGVTELLGVVLALSARTRRTVLPHVTVELDVFAPHGERAVNLSLPTRA